MGGREEKAEEEEERVRKIEEETGREGQRESELTAVVRTTSEGSPFKGFSSIVQVIPFLTSLN